MGLKNVPVLYLDIQIYKTNVEACFCAMGT
jgi:hypothetical protein